MIVSGHNNRIAQGLPRVSKVNCALRYVKAVLQRSREFAIALHGVYSPICAGAPLLGFAFLGCLYSVRSLFWGK
jgi:hypothetical protein